MNIGSILYSYTLPKNKFLILVGMQNFLFTCIFYIDDDIHEVSILFLLFKDFAPIYTAY